MTVVYDADESLTLICVIDESEVSFIEHSIRSVYLQVSFFGCGVIVGWSMVLISHFFDVFFTVHCMCCVLVVYRTKRVNLRFLSPSSLRTVSSSPYADASDRLPSSVAS